MKYIKKAHKFVAHEQLSKTQIMLTIISVLLLLSAFINLVEAYRYRAMMQKERKCRE